MKSAGQTVAGVAKKAAGPVLAVGAAAAVAGIALSQRQPRKKVLGVPMPKGISKPKVSVPKVSMPKVSTPSLPDLDSKSVAKTAKKVGKASRRFSEASRSVSRDIDRVADQADRIGRVLS